MLRLCSSYELPVVIFVFPSLFLTAKPLGNHLESCSCASGTGRERKNFEAIIHWPWPRECTHVRVGGEARQQNQANIQNRARRQEISQTQALASKSGSAGRPREDALCLMSSSCPQSSLLQLHRVTKAIFPRQAGLPKIFKKSPGLLSSLSTLLSSPLETLFHLCN